MASVGWEGSEGAKVCTHSARPIKSVPSRAREGRADEGSRVGRGRRGGDSVQG
jgi:hypothetical protein